MISMLKDSYERGDKSLIKRSKRLIGKKKQQSFAGDGRIENWGGGHGLMHREMDDKKKTKERQTEAGKNARGRRKHRRTGQLNTETQRESRHRRRRRCHRLSEAGHFCQKHFVILESITFRSPFDKLAAVIFSILIPILKVQQINNFLRRNDRQKAAPNSGH